MSALSSDHVPLLMPAPPAAAKPLDSKKVYLCGHCRSYARYSDDPTAKCPSCHNNLNLEPTYVAPPVKAQPSSAGGGEGGGGGGGFVRGVVGYMVMDDLKVMPQSTISAITTMNDSNINDFGSLEVKVVSLDVDVGMKLLKAALHTDSVLTTVFLGKN
ncbi:hypothetical protein DM860_010735 [Cuscuta australis]|uniref:Uncharacterized protein n=1 Tax=Cuscuta australis TaxID=267555 RepID=A0A328E428_9ASTE|nr:hypothetical protein DM860_010735 [Cuscuta australis]